MIHIKTYMIINLTGTYWNENLKSIIILIQQKAYKCLYGSEAATDKGTLRYFKAILNRTDVTGKVKSNYQAHENLLLTVGQGIMVEQALELFKMDDSSCTPIFPDGIDAPADDATKEEKIASYDKIMRFFINNCGYGDIQFQLDHKPRVPQSYIVKVNGNGQLVATPHMTGFDMVEVYSTNICHWTLHLMQLNDTAKEGDVIRLIPNLKHVIPFFYSASHLSKYMIEATDFILKASKLSSPRSSMRVLEGAFVNPVGGAGKNIEADLKQEHKVRVTKDAIQSLGANKSEKAVMRITRAVDSIDQCCTNFDEKCDIAVKGGKHTKKSTEADKDKVQKILRQLRPFKITPGRKCTGFKYESLKHSPVSSLKPEDLHTSLEALVKRLSRGQVDMGESDESENEDEEA